MSDDGEKAFAATASRRKRAVRDGNVARSVELGGGIAFACGLAAAAAAVPLGAQLFGAALRDAARVQGTNANGLAVAAATALGPALAASAGGVTFALLQGGGLHVGAITFDPKRLDPIAGLKRLAGSDALIAAARAAVTFAVAVLVLVPVGHDLLAAAVAVRSPAAAAVVAGAGALRAGLAAIAVGLVFGIAEYAAAHRRWLRGLKMSHDEAKRDAKENDGDPHSRSRRKSLHRDLIRGAIARTSEASFVVVNPTHVAVALRYAPPAVPVPEILVRAIDEGALRVRELARAAGVPIVEDAPLARILFATSTRSRTIAPETYVAVAQIVAELAQAGLLR